MQYANPQVGDVVSVYQDSNQIIVKKAQSSAPNITINGPTDRREVNKILYILLTFFVGALGVHRFMRGQVGLGILMLLLGWWITVGIWPLVDFIISLVKLPKFPGENYVFTPDGRWAQ
ncbi:TM2 domain-containing protein [Candidatus Saccharibacteria bacterium]|nr:TM2 domain-containing protein [Candidatus Saccharibacteria bacterium]